MAAAMGLRFANRGLVTAILELSSFQTIPAMFGVQGKGYEPVLCAANLYTSTVSWQEALAEYGLIKLKFKRLYRLVFENPFMRRVVPATPGLQEILVMGKVFYVLDKGFQKGPTPDVVVVDAPATGHGKAMLTTPMAVAESVPSGPLAAETQTMKSRLLDTRFTRVHVVVTPEEMPVVEGLELMRDLEREGISTAELIVNQVETTGLDEREAEALRVLQSDSSLPREAGYAVRAALFMGARYASQHAHVRRLRKAVDGPLVLLPWVPKEGVERVEKLSRTLSSLMGS